MGSVRLIGGPLRGTGADAENAAGGPARLGARRARRSGRACLISRGCQRRRGRLGVLAVSCPTARLAFSERAAFRPTAGSGRYGSELVPPPTGAAESEEDPVDLLPSAPPSPTPPPADPPPASVPAPDRPPPPPPSADRADVLVSLADLLAASTVVVRGTAETNPVEDRTCRLTPSLPAICYVQEFTRGPDLEPGGQYVLFLYPFEWVRDEPEGDYQVAGLFAGLFAVDDRGALRSLDGETPELAAITDISEVQARHGQAPGLIGTKVRRAPPGTASMSPR